MRSRKPAAPSPAPAPTTSAIVTSPSLEEASHAAARRTGLPRAPAASVVATGAMLTLSTLGRLASGRTTQPAQQCAETELVGHPSVQFGQVWDAAGQDRELGRGEGGQALTPGWARCIDGESRCLREGVPAGVADGCAIDRQ